MHGGVFVNRGASQDNPSPIAAKLAELRVRFMDMLEDRLEVLSALRETLAATPREAATLPDLLDTLRFEVHRMAGISGTLGFMELGRMSQRVELAVLGLREGTLPPTTLRMVITPLDEMLDEMTLLKAARAELDQAARRG